MQTGVPKAVNALVVEHGQDRADRGAEGGEEVGPAAGRESAEVVGLHIGAVGVQEARVVHDVVLRGLVETGGGLLGLRDGALKLRVRELLGLVDELTGLDRLELHTEGVHQLAVQRAAEAEALGGVADGGHLEAAHFLFNTRGGDGGLHGPDGLLLLGRAEDVGEGAVIKGAQGVRGGVGAGQGVEAQAAAVDHGLAQGPEEHRAGKAAQHLGHIGGVGEGQILEDDQVGLHAVEKGAELVHREQHLVGADDVLVDRAEHGAGALKLILGGLQMIGGHAHRNVHRTEIHNRTSKYYLTL